MDSIIRTQKESFIDQVGKELIQLFNFRVFDHMFHIELYRDNFRCTFTKEDIREYGSFLKGSYLSTAYWIETEFKEKYEAWKLTHNQ